MKIKFDLQNSSTYGGSIPFLEYLNRIKIKDIVSSYLSEYKRKNAKYSLADITLQGIVAYTLGLERPFHFQNIEKDPIITKKLKLKKFPDFTIYYKDLRKFQDEGDINQLKKANIALLKLQDELVVDFDSSVVTVYGNQEGAEVGYNPKKRGRNSYHPIFAYERKRGHCINARLREGNVNTAWEFREFFKEAEKHLGGKIIKISCLDRGFEGNENYSFLESEGRFYIGKLHRRGTLFNQKIGYRKIEGDIEVASCIEKLPSWDKPRRIVYIKKPIDTRKKIKQLNLFEEGDYEYEVFVTNLYWAEEEIWRFYNYRGQAENYIKELRAGFFIEKEGIRRFL